MKPSWKESADLKQALKHDPETPALRREAEEFPQEAAEALEEAETLDPATPGSWAARRTTTTEEVAT